MTPGATILRLLFGMMLIAATWAASPSSTQEHTQVYQQWKQGRFSQTFYLHQTFLGYEGDDIRCQPLSDDPTTRRRQYIQLLQQRDIACTGSWCVEGQFKCLSGDSQNCYNLEHVVDLHHSILGEYNKNIMGNIVMAYGLWNQQLGRMAWSQVEAEKREIYGDPLVNSAMLAIIACGERAAAGSGEAEVPIEVSSNFSVSDWVGIIFGGLVLTGVAGLLILVCRARSRLAHQPLPQTDGSELSSEADQREVSDAEPAGPELDPALEVSDLEAAEQAPLPTA